MTELSNTIQQLRMRLIEFRLSEPFEETSMHINAIEIAICLAEYSLKTNPVRSISKEEERWFEAGYYIELVLVNSEWKNMVDLYYELVSIIKKKNFFRKKKQIYTQESACAGLKGGRHCR